MHLDVIRFNNDQAPGDREICERLAREIDRHLPEAENDIWHRLPVWFLDGNPVAGYLGLQPCTGDCACDGRRFRVAGRLELNPPGRGGWVRSAIAVKAASRNRADRSPWRDVWPGRRRMPLARLYRKPEGGRPPHR